MAKTKTDSVDLIASGYEWTCPECNHFNREIEATETVNVPRNAAGQRGNRDRDERLRRNFRSRPSFTRREKQPHLLNMKSLDNDELHQ